jgi:hypothetical protein
MLMQIPTIELGISTSDSSDWMLVDIENLASPKNGWICIVDQYWLLIDNKIVFYKDKPLYNFSESFLEYLITVEDFLKDAKIVKFSVLFVKN